MGVWGDMERVGEGCKDVVHVYTMYIVTVSVVNGNSPSSPCDDSLNARPRYTLNRSMSVMRVLSPFPISLRSHVTLITTASSLQLPAVTLTCDSPTANTTMPLLLK